MKKCYIAGKIGDLPEQLYKANFENAKAEVSKLDLKPISPVDLPHLHNHTWNDYMREDLIELLKCDYVYALNNWKQSPGATIEIELAISVGIPIIYQEAFSVKSLGKPELYGVIE